MSRQISLTFFRSARPEGPLQAAQPLLQQNSGFQPARPMPQSLQQPAQPAQPVQPAQPQQLAQPFQPLQPAPSLTPCAAPMAPMAPPTPTGPNPFRQNNAESGGFIDIEIFIEIFHCNVIKMASLDCTPWHIAGFPPGAAPGEQVHQIMNRHF